MYRLETQRVLSDELKNEIVQQQDAAGGQPAGPSYHSSDYGGSSVDECQNYDNLWFLWFVSNISIFINFCFVFQGVVCANENAPTV